MENRIGYLIEYSKSKGLFDGFEERKNVLCSQEKLIDLLQHRLSGNVWSARWVNIDEYQMNHEKKLEVWGFENE